MLLKISQYIYGYVRIQITGQRIERFLNACSYKKIQMWDVSKSGNSCEMNVFVKDFKKLRHISRKTSTQLRITKKYGLPFYLFQHRRRKLFFFGIFAALFLFFIMSGFVWDIEILGTQTRTEEVIRDFLKDKNVTPGMPRSQIDCERIAKDIRKEYDDIIWVSASVDGTQLIIQIKENEDIKQITEEKESPTDLISDCSGTIIHMITRSGVPQVKEGSDIHPGDILISGQIPILNDAQEITGYRSCHSDADIFVQEQISYQDKITRTYQKKQTIQKPVLWKLYIRSDNYRLSPFFNWKPYKYYTMTSKEVQVKLLDHFFLPIYIGSIRQTPYSPVTQKYTDHKLQTLLNHRFLRYCEDLNKKGVEIIQNDVKIDTGSKEGCLSGTLTIIKKAGQSKPSETPKLPASQEEQIESLGE